MKKILPILIVVLGLGAGVGAGAFLRPAPPPACEEGSKDCAEEAGSYTDVEYIEEPEAVEPNEFVRLPKQFIVPVIKRGQVHSLVVMSISVEVEAGTMDSVLSRSPKLRDAFLQVLFDHSNSGGFDGAFTSGQPMQDLRGALLDVTRKKVGSAAVNILITDMVKQAV